MEVECGHCGVPFKKTPFEMKRSKTGSHYCGRSCAAKANNKLFPKRQMSNRCRTCDKPIPHDVSFCSKNCNPRTVPDGQTLGEFIQKKVKRDANLYNQIRQRARAVAFSSKPKVCEKCGYSKHVEVCHKRAISDFPMDANIKEEINNIKNLLVLCPNCHWEHDHP